MKYVTYEVHGAQGVRVLDGNRVLDAGFEGDMVAFIEAGSPVGATRAVVGARLLAPLRPRTMRDFVAFEGHLRNAFKGPGLEVPTEWYEVPVYYKGLPETVIGPDEVIPWPSYSEQLDFELELAVVIGHAGKDITAERALQHVFGYTIWNDLSARDTQRTCSSDRRPGKARWRGSS